MDGSKGIITCEQVSIIMMLIMGVAFLMIFSIENEMLILAGIAALILLPLMFIGMPLIVIDLIVRERKLTQYEKDIHEKWRKQNERFREQGYEIIT